MTVKSTKTLMALSIVMSIGALSPGQAQDVTIAVVGPLTGPYASYGEQQVRGAQAAASLINERSVLNGRKIKIVTEDDACDPKQAVAVANRIVAQHIKFVAGHTCSGAAIPASEVYGENNVLMMTPSASNPALTDKAAERNHQTIMRMYGRDDAQGLFVGQWLARSFKGKKVAILHDKAPYGRGLAAAVKESANRAGLSEIMFDGINPGEKDYRAVVSKLMAAGAEVVYFGGYPTEAGLIRRQAAEQAVNFTMMTGDSIATPEFWAISGPAGEGTLFTFPSDPRRSASATEVVERFKKQGVEPEGFTLFTHAVVEAIAEGIKRTGSDDPQSVARALKDGPATPTVIGAIRFDKKGDIADPKYDINVWRDGKYAPLQ